MSKILPELAEADAPDSIRCVYAALRAGASSPIAALIWRHIATHPGVLEACWASLQPLFAASRLSNTAWRIARETTPHELLPHIGPRARALLGITPEDTTTLLALVEAYNRANPVNMLGVMTLLARIDIDGPPEAVPAFTPPPPLAAITRAIPRMTPPAEMSSDVLWVLNDLGFGDRSQLHPVVPSLYRHLTGWPAYLALLHTNLAPKFRDGAMADAVDRVKRAMAAEAATLARTIAPVEALADKPALQATMRHFAGNTIPMMIVVVRGMADQLGD